MTTKQTEAHGTPPAAEPLALSLHDLLGLASVAPGPTGYSIEAVKVCVEGAYKAGQAAGRERCAAWVEARRDAFCAEHGSVDPDTGALEFGRGPHAEAKNEYVGELEEIADGLRALKA